MVPVTPRGPAADNQFPISTHPSNPYGFSPQLFHAGTLSPKITDKYVLFFGYEGSNPLVCLSQWFPAPFQAVSSPTLRPGSEIDLVEFPTAEHYMMYQKAISMDDYEIAHQILQMPHPSAAKRLGRQVKNFDSTKWSSLADQVVEDGNWYKFTSSPELSEVLLSTGEKMLIEASPEDRIWGIGFNSEDAEGKEAEWGSNRLGKALMKVRERLRNQSKE